MFTFPIHIPTYNTVDHEWKYY